MQTVAAAIKPVLLLRKDICESVRRRVAERTKLLRINEQKLKSLKGQVLDKLLGFAQRSKQGENGRRRADWAIVR